MPPGGSVVEQARKARGVLSATDVYTIFEAYGSPSPPGRWWIPRPGRCSGRRDRLPVVVKVDSEAIDHKSAWAGRRQPQDAAAVRAAVGDAARLERPARSVSSSRNSSRGRELIVGASVSRGLGHLVMFGWRIYVEVLKDVPSDRAGHAVEAREMSPPSGRRRCRRDAREKDRQERYRPDLRVSQLLTDSR